VDIAGSFMTCRTPGQRVRRGAIQFYKTAIVDCSNKAAGIGTVSGTRCDNFSIMIHKYLYTSKKKNRPEIFKNTAGSIYRDRP
jgi:hypothetical protein